MSLHAQDERPISVLLIDVDNFEQVNDQYGHVEGDRCLAAGVGILCAAISGKGKLYRVGGDEFCTVLLNFCGFESAATAERMRRSIEAMELFGGTTKVTTSIGVAGTDVQRETDPESLIRAADEAMYVSKWTTKNRVTTWPPSQEDRKLAHENRERAKLGLTLGPQQR